MSNFNGEEKNIFVCHVKDIFLSDYTFEFCTENGRIFAKGKLNVPEDFIRPYEKESEKVVQAPITEEPVIEAPVETVEEKVEEPVVEAPVEEPVEEIVEEEPVEENTIETSSEDNNSEDDSDESEVIVVDGKKVIIRYNYSFRARLIQSTEQVQVWYQMLTEEASSYKDLKMKESWNKIRLSVGRKTLAIIRFRGKKLCVAYALNPSDYE